MLSASDLAAMQATITAALDQPCTIERNATTRNSYGYTSDNYAAIKTTVCNVAQPSASLMQNYDYLIGPLATWLVRLPVGTDVKRNDRIVVGGQTLTVQVLLQPRSYQLAVRVLASEIE